MQEVMSAWTSEGDEKVTDLKLMAVYEAELGDKGTTGNANDDLDNADGAMRMSKDTIESSLHISKTFFQTRNSKLWLSTLRRCCEIKAHGTPCHT